MPLEAFFFADGPMDYFDCGMDLLAADCLGGSVGDRLEGRGGSGGVGDGLDALLSTVMMPPGVPVATVGVGGAVNAALLAVQILALSDRMLADKLAEYKKTAAEKVKKKDLAIQEKYNLKKV